MQPFNLEAVLCMAAGDCGMTCEHVMSVRFVNDQTIKTCKLCEHVELASSHSIPVISGGLYVLESS